MGLSTIELVASSLGTSFIGGAIVLLTSKFEFLKEQRWRGPRVVICIATVVSAILAWAMYLMEVIHQDQGESSGPDVTYGLMVLVFGLMGTLKRLIAWSRMNRGGVGSVALQTSITWVAWIFIALAMIESLVFLFMGIMSDQPPSLVLVCALFGLTFLSEMVVWFSLILNGLRIGSRAISVVLEMIYIWSLIGYLLTNATHNISFRPIYEIYLSSGILALIVVAECFHPSAFPDLAKECIPPSQSIVSRRSVTESMPEKVDPPRSFLSVRFDSSNLSDVARNIILEAGLQMQAKTEESAPGPSSYGRALCNDVSTNQRDPPSESDLSGFVDCTTPSIGYVSQGDPPETLRNASMILEMKESEDSIYSNHPINNDTDEEASIISQTLRTSPEEIGGIPSITEPTTSSHISTVSLMSERGPPRMHYALRTMRFVLRSL
ncbi:hypothetical protein DFH28DRAFT_64949 [Melampsora americana]|nr:hypothetical protein DFH28DRAFT_64949 [Melampsora americana]